MAVESFKRINWNTGDSTDIAKLNTMVSNEFWLFENTPRITYRGWDINRTKGVKILATVTYLAVNPTRERVRRGISFGSFFTAGCRPIVVTGVNSAESTNVTCGIRGYQQFAIDHRGVEITLNTARKGAKFTSAANVHVLAVGY